MNIDEKFDIQCYNTKESIDDEIKKKLAIQDKLAKNYWGLCQFFWVKSSGNNIPNLVKIWYNAGGLMERINPHFNIKQSGTFIYKYRNEILNDNLDWIIHNDFSSQMNDWRFMLSSVSTKLSNALEPALCNIRNFLIDRINVINTPDGVKSGLQFCKNLLIWYSRYSILDKEISELQYKHKNM